MTDIPVIPNKVPDPDRTSSTLLAKLKAKDDEGWKRFVYLYGPLIYKWCRKFGLQETDAADVGQDVFQTVVNTIDRYDHDRPGASFRGWLRSITHTRVCDFYRRNRPEEIGVGGSDNRDRILDIVIEGQAEDSDSVAEKESDELLLKRRVIELVLNSCQEKSRKAFLRLVVDGHSPAEVARELVMTVNAVYQAKSHILRRIREEWDQLFEV